MRRIYNETGQYFFKKGILLNLLYRSYIKETFYLLNCCYPPTVEQDRDVLYALFSGRCVVHTSRLPSALPANGSTYVGWLTMS